MYSCEATNGYSDFQVSNKLRETADSKLCVGVLLSALLLARKSGFLVADFMDTVQGLGCSCSTGSGQVFGYRVLGPYP